MQSLNLQALPANFDWRYYLDVHPDLQRAGLSNEHQAIVHYLRYGHKEQRVYCNTGPRNNAVVSGLCDNQLVLCTQWYDDPSTETYRTECLIRNLNNPFIQHIHIFYENHYQALQEITKLHNHVSYSAINDSVSYTYWMKYSDEHFPDMVKILSNSDIFFDETLKLVTHIAFEPNSLYAITRKDFDVHTSTILPSHDLFNDHSRPTNPIYSQDCWLYKHPLLNDQNKHLFDLKLGYDNCDRLLKTSIEKQKINFINLYPQVNALHIDYRTQKTHKAYELVQTRKANAYKILIKIPTHYRPQQLLECIESFKKHCQDLKNLQIVISVNDTDVSTQSIINQLSQYDFVQLRFGNYINKIDAYNADINDIDFDILIMASDDMEAVCPDYDRLVRDLMYQYFPDTEGCLWFDTGDNNFITNTIVVIGKKLFEKIKPIYNPAYSGYFCDDEFTQKCIKLGKIVKIPHCIIKHRISAHLEMHNDFTYLKSLRYATVDKAMYKIRKSVQFDIPGLEPLPHNHNLPVKSTQLYRNDGWSQHWHKSESWYDDPLSVTDIYILEKQYKKILSMSPEQFSKFAHNYFRNFRFTIPKIIHQIWLGDKNSEIDIMMQSFSKSYVEKYPDWRYILWDEHKLANLNMINNDLYHQEKAYDCKSDIARLEILHQFGGIYIDSDMIWLKHKPLNNLLQNDDRGLLLFQEKSGSAIGDKYLSADTTRCSNGVIGSTIMNPIVSFLIGKLRQSYVENRRHGVVASTGPDFIQKYVDILNIAVNSHEYVFPVWFCIDEARNPDYNNFMAYKSATELEIINKHPTAILFHKGWER